MNKRIIIAGGGTGGHIFPAIAIAQALEKCLPVCEFLFVGAKGKMEMEKIPQAGYKIIGLPISGFNRSSLWKNIGLPFKLLASLWKSRQIIRQFKPHAVIGVGGYSTFPVLREAQRKQIPTFIHEANSFAGRSNMLLAKNAVRVFTASQGMERFFPAEKIMVTGNPVRLSIINNHYTKEEASRFFELEANRKTVLVIGGSLGARSINEAIAAGLSALKEQGLQLIWQTGKGYADEARKLSASYQGIWINEFIQDMAAAYAAADVVVSRAGAMSVAELSLAGKPVIFVPYPHAAEDHQTANARYLVDRKAALLVSDKDAASGLVTAILKLTSDADLQQELKENIRKHAIADADQQVANYIMEVIGQ